MAFASGCGVEVTEDSLPALFCEELGAVLQVREADEARVGEAFSGAGVAVRRVGRPRDDRRVRLGARYDESLDVLRGWWSDTTWRMQRLRDDEGCADEEHVLRTDAANPGLHAKVTFQVAAPAVLRGARPRVAILREQGVNGHVEMAAAFTRAGFEAVDVHMSDVLEGRDDLGGYRGLAACGGFSYGDVLGAGSGWAKTILFDPRAREAFGRFFHRPDTFSLGVCNGCQAMSHLRDLVPGASHWPRFRRNRSEQFEARLVMVRVERSPSVLLRGMEGSLLPVVVSHGEGRVESADLAALEPFVAARYVDGHGAPTERYPWNPNASPGGITAVTSVDGRATILMPHPERVVRTVTYSWHPRTWGDDGPWLQLFHNARAWVG